MENNDDSGSKNIQLFNSIFFKKFGVVRLFDCCTYQDKTIEFDKQFRLMRKNV